MDAIAMSFLICLVLHLLNGDWLIVLYSMYIIMTGLAVISDNQAKILREIESIKKGNLK